MGELLEDREKYRSAIAWYKRCCSYSANGKRGVLAQAGDLCNLGLAQKRASQWKDSLASYDECLRLIAEELERIGEEGEGEAADAAAKRVGGGRGALPSPRHPRAAASKLAKKTVKSAGTGAFPYNP